MKRLFIVVEGQTEEAFVKELMAPYFIQNGIYDVRPVIRIGLPTILARCPRFRGWIDYLIHRCLE